MTVLRRPGAADSIELRLSGLPPAVVTRAARAVGCSRRASVAEQLGALRAATGHAAASAVVLLCDGYGATVERVAELLDHPADLVARRLEEGRPRDDRSVATSGCPAWPLVVRLRSLPADERAAAVAHLDSCRRCRDAVPRART